MKINLNADELDELEQLSDSDLAELVRTSLKKFRGKSKTGAEAEDDLAEADPSSAGHGGQTTSTLEATASQRAGTLQATQDAARQAFDRRLREDERSAEAETIIPGYGRL